MISDGKSKEKTWDPTTIHDKIIIRITKTNTTDNNNNNKPHALESQWRWDFV